jgi:addiction module HigA family antidote
MNTAHEPIPPGEILLEEFLRPLEISQYRLAQAINVPARRINEIVHGKRGISPDTAARLARRSAHLIGSGRTCRPATTWSSSPKRRPRSSTGSFRCSAPESAHEQTVAASASSRRVAGTGSSEGCRDADQ